MFEFAHLFMHNPYWFVGSVVALGYVIAFGVIFFGGL